MKQKIQKNTSKNIIQIKPLFLILILFIFSCNTKRINILELREGTFETTLPDKNVKSIAFRDKNIQIETYNNKKDTFTIKWLNNFEYELLKINPKSSLDSVPFIVKITKLSHNGYSFKAHYKGNKYIQKGEAVKLTTK